jgi:hypothetical protein
VTVKALAAKRQGHSLALGLDENPFSTNKVTGHSLNFPIIGTCTPTGVCADTCYFAKGPSTWSASLAKQHRLLNSLRDNPVRLAHMIARHARRLKLTFIRWNGGGDCVEETPACVDEVALLMPHVPQWVVTRKPEIAARLPCRSNVYVHFSIDRASWQRLDEFRRLAPASLQWFWSYQCDKDEVPHDAVAPVIFRDGYKLNGSEPLRDDCPLNLSESIVRVCESCRRCFNGAAIERAKECHSLSPVSSPRLFG